MTTETFTKHHQAISVFV